MHHDFSLGRHYLGMVGTEPRGLCVLCKISTMASTLLTFYFQRASHQVTQVGLKLAILLSQPPPQACGSGLAVKHLEEDVVPPHDETGTKQFHLTANQSENLQKDTSSLSPFPQTESHHAAMTARSLGRTLG